MKQLTPRLIMLPIISALLMLVGLPRIGALPAKAATTAVINITTTDDELNTDQDCSLREAIQAANTDTAVDACAAGSGADTINIPAGTYIITIPGTNEDANATGDWDVLSPITLQGAGMGNTVLNGGGLDMVLHGINTDLTIRSLTITNGDGGMLQNGGNLVVESVRIAGNTAISWRAGGATVFNANATMTDSIVEDNHFNATSHWQGGGYAFSATVGGPMLSMRIERSIIRNNTNKSHGGGIFFGTNTGRPMTGLITNSAIVGNKTIGVGGGLMTDDTGTLTVENTTISDNEASIGSAIFADASANSILLRHVTITNNRTTTGYGGYGRFGGGVVTWGSPITFEKSILYGNVDIHSPARPDCYEPVSSRKIISNGYNIIGDIGNCTALTHATDLPVGTNPLLSPLSGAMPVHKLTTGSPAIDYSPSPCLPVDDQVGTTRANGSSTGTKCDVGAWEYGGNTNLALYALAFDNKLNTAGDLSSQYSDTIEGIRLATVGNAKHAVVLADLPGLNNTIVLDIRNGVITPVVGLPDASFALDTSLYEYDMANGQQLGQFLRWAINTYPADKVFFSYIGHGNALVPENDLSNDVDAALATTPAPAGWPAFEEASSGKLAMLPAGHGVNPNLTDYQSKSILSVYDLANALQIGTNNGTTQLDLLDIIHCFAASIEELYALRNYASVTTAGPNYVFFQGEMPGAGLAAMNFSDPADAMASQLLDAYETEIPSTGHPHVLTAVDNSLLEDVKTAWDQTAYYIDQLFTTDPSSTKGNLLTAYQTTGAYYDTTSCQPQDWELAPPDALVDFVPFIDQLHPLLDPLGDNGVSANALLTQARLNAAIITTRKQSGNPWFAPTKTWDFSNHTGIGLFANFEYMQLTTNGSTANYLSWQAPFYNSTTSASNPQPYNFVQDGFAGSTWATVFNNYWGWYAPTKPRCAWANRLGYKKWVS
jgi:CSLREA domain-containing protein